MIFLLKLNYPQRIFKQMTASLQKRYQTYVENYLEEDEFSESIVEKKNWSFISSLWEEQREKLLKKLLIDYDQIVIYFKFDDFIEFFHFFLSTLNKDKVTENTVEYLRILLIEHDVQYKFFDEELTFLLDNGFDFKKLKEEDVEKLHNYFIHYFDGIKFNSFVSNLHDKIFSLLPPLNTKKKKCYIVENKVFLKREDAEKDAQLGELGIKEAELYD